MADNTTTTEPQNLWEGSPNPDPWTAAAHNELKEEDGHWEYMVRKSQNEGKGTRKKTHGGVRHPDARLFRTRCTRGLFSSSTVCTYSAALDARPPQAMPHITTSTTSP